MAFRFVAVSSLIYLLGWTNAQNPDPSSCPSFQLWHVASQKCVVADPIGTNRLPRLASSCHNNGFISRFPSDTDATFTLLAGHQEFRGYCIHPSGGSATPPNPPLLWHPHNCYDNAARLSHRWSKSNDLLNSFTIRHGAVANRCVRPVNNNVGAMLTYSEAACSDNTNSKFVASCDGLNPFTRPTTKTSTTTTTTTTTTTVTTKTDTIQQQLQGKLSGVSELLEQQILSYDSQIKSLQSTVKSLTSQMQTANSERRSANSRADTLESELSMQKSSMQQLRRALTALPQTPVTIDAPEECSDDSTDQNLPPQIQVDSSGLGLDVMACSGSITLRSSDCAVNPCKLQQEVRMIQQLLQDVKDE